MDYRQMGGKFGDAEIRTSPVSRGWENPITRFFVWVLAAPLTIFVSTYIACVVLSKTADGLTKPWVIGAAVVCTVWVIGCIRGDESEEPGFGRMIIGFAKNHPLIYSVLMGVFAKILFFFVKIKY